MFASNKFVRTTLVSGDAELCRTFLFEAAFSWAKEGLHAYYFMSKQIESLPLSYHGRSEPSADALKAITFIYTSNYEILAGQLIKLHTFQKPASVILIDNLDEFSSYPEIKNSSRELHIARLCAVLLNTTLACSRVINQPVHLCAASFGNEDYRKVYEKYFDNRWIASLEFAVGDAEENRKFWMKRDDGSRALEFCRLDDGILALKNIFGTDEDDDDDSL